MGESWEDLMDHWQIDPIKADQKFAEIRRAYSEPNRSYHTLDHVLTVLTTVNILSQHAKNLSAVRLAAWLHDVIYESKASDNEERSAEYAVRMCEELSIPVGELVADLIRKTKTHDAGDDVDAQVLLDADLAILGAGEPQYQDYAAKIRQEYAWVSEADYRKGRRQVLEKFLTRPRIYHFLSELEAPARRNLAAEIRVLSVSPQELSLLPDTFAICRLDAQAAVPGWATGDGFFSITRTAEELSVVCLQSLVPDGIKCERDWRCFKLAGPIPFTAVGVLASLVQPLAEARISVFAISTFDTDYLLVKAADLERSIKVLRQAGHSVQ